MPKWIEGHRENHQIAFLLEKRRFEIIIFPVAKTTIKKLLAKVFRI
jgi:hypothetical protein